MANERGITGIDIQTSLNQIAEDTTAAELVRTKGQTKKVRVLSERKLMEWILALIQQHMAAKQDSFSDQEKEEMLRKAQEELARRMQREKDVESENQRIQAQLDQALAQIALAGDQGGDTSGIDSAIQALRAQLAESDNLRNDLQQDNYELQDQLQEKLNLLSTTIAEKDKLRDTVRNQMLRSNALVEGVLGLDGTYYAGRHVDGNPVADEASDDEQFYHDFDVGALVIATLSQDLERLRAITGQLGEGDDQRSLAQDLDLLAQVRSGSLHAMDVAAPVSGLVEALGGARAEAEALDEEVAAATGGQTKPISALPDADGEPGQVLAGATAVARELATELARNRLRIAALRNMADEADAARNQTESEVEQLRAELETARAAPAATAAPRDQEAAASQQRAVARALLEAAKGDDHLADSAAELALGLDVDSPLDDSYSTQVVQGVHDLAHRKRELERELAQARAEALAARTLAGEAELAVENERGETQRLRRTTDATSSAAAAAAAELATANARVEHMRRELDEALALVRQAQDDAEAAKADAVEAAAKLRALDERHTERVRADRRLASELLTVAKEDDLLADVTTDLSVALDDDQAGNDIQQQLGKTVNALAQRQQSLTAENSRLGRDSERLRAEVSEAKRSLADTQRAVAAAVIAAGRDDDDLKGSIGQLEWALERLRPGEPMPSDLLQMLNDALGKLAQRKQALQSERDEMALNGKEIIGALTATRDQRESEVKLLRSETDAANDRLALLESRTAAAEAANRQLAETLSRVGATLPADSQEPRVDLELALSQLPDEGEEGIDIPADVAPQIATHGERVILALAESQRQATAALARANAERARLEQELAERSSGNQRHSADLAQVRNELADARIQSAATQAQSAALQADLARSRLDMSTAAKALAEARAELERAQDRQRSTADEVALRAAESEGLKLRIAALERQLTQASAESAEREARGGATGDSLREELAQLRKDQLAERDAVKRKDAESQELREKVESAEARYRRLKEEFSQRLAERDETILDKDRQLDQIADQRTDLSGLQAQVGELTHQLTQANLQIAELEAKHSVSAGATGRHSNLGNELKRAHADRDLLREQKRTLEADLAESHSSHEDLKAQNDELRKEMLAIREQVEKTIGAERAKADKLREENGQLRADNVGLQTKVRKLSGS